MTAATDDFDDRLRDAKLASLAEFAAGAGHEINNPVATILGRAQQLLRHETDPNRRRALATIASQALRIRDMIGDLMLFARPPEAEPAWIDLGELVLEAAGPLRELASDVEVTLNVETNPVRAFLDPLQIAIAVTALIENAINASSADGTVTVTVSERDGRTQIIVEDCGTGFSETDREHAFDPFYSGRQAGRGLGFGLPKAWRIVTSAGGKIDVASNPGHTIATISFSLPGSTEIDDESPATSAKPPRRKRG